MEPGKFRNRRLQPKTAESPHFADNETLLSLDLTAASRAYLLEPQWNPMIEEQALSRIHRLGQKKEVRTIRYRVRNSFEDVS